MNWLQGGGMIEVKCYWNKLGRESRRSPPLREWRIQKVPEVGLHIDLLSGVDPSTEEADAQVLLLLGNKSGQGSLGDCACVGPKRNR